MDDEVEVPSMHVVLADQPGGIGLRHRRLKALAFAYELAAHVGVTGVRAHGEGCQQRTLDQQMRIMAHDLAVLARAGFGLIGIDHEIAWTRIVLGRERPFWAGREAGTAPATQAGILDFGDDGVVPLFDQRLGAVPGTARLGPRQPPVVEAVEVLEDPVLVPESHGGSVPSLRS